MRNIKRELPIDPDLARESQAVVALAFRNGPIEDVHAGRDCPTCSEKAEYSRITDAEMKLIMKKAVDTVYALLWIRTHCPSVYQHVIRVGNHYTHGWDLPENSRNEIETITRLAERMGQ